MNTFTGHVLKTLESCKAPACVGIDPHLDRIPLNFFEQAKKKHSSDSEILTQAVATFCSELVEVLYDSGIRIIKPQVAFFEQLGTASLALYEKICKQAQAKDMLVIADIKRGDIGSTSNAYAAGWLQGTSFAHYQTTPFSVDAITINPYLGSDGVLPFLKAAQNAGRGIFVLLKTSNPSSTELQDQKLASGPPLYLSLAKKLADLAQSSCEESTGYSPLGVVVGATFPSAAQQLREVLPHSFFLVPGFGAQGAKADDLLPFFHKDGRGAIINSSRGVIHAYGDSSFSGDWKQAVHQAAKNFQDEIAFIVQQAQS